MSGRLVGKVAVVTGGGNGIGRACCERFAEEGALVVVADLQTERADEVRDKIEAGGGKALSVQLDAADRESNVRMIEQANEAFGGVDILLTAAGISHAAYVSGDREVERQQLQEAAGRMTDPSSAFLDLTVDQWQKVLDVNLTGTFHAVQEAGRAMVAAGKGGSIITIASVAAKSPDAGPLAYAVSKSGVWMLTKHVARSLGPSGIRVNAIGPGFIETNMTRIISELEMVREQFLQRIPLRRLGQPIDIAHTAVFLASDESSYFTGELLHPDGGYYTD